MEAAPIEVSREQPRILLLPVSGPGGAGEFYRSLAIARGIARHWPQAVIEIVASRDASYAKDSPFALRLVDRSPTFETEAVKQILADFRPDVAIFDSSGRVDQYRAAQAAGARVVFVSSRPSTRRKGFRLRRMRWFDQHWIAQPRFLGGGLTRAERLKLQLLGGLEPLFLDVLHEPVDEQAAAARLRAAGASAGRYVLVCPGGGGVFGSQPDAVPVFHAAACAIAAETRLPVIAVLGSRFTPPASPTPGVSIVTTLPNGELMGLLRDARVAVLNGGSLLVQAIAQRTPSIAAPIAEDQPARIAACAAAGLTRATALDARELASAAVELVADESRLAGMRQRASELNLQSGVETAVRALARWLPPPGTPAKSSPSSSALPAAAVSGRGDAGRLRILHVILSSGFAGSERAAAEACNAMCAEHDVAIVLRSDHRRAAVGSIRDHLADDVEVIEIPRSLLTHAALDRALRRWRPDVVHTHLRRGTRLIAQLRPSAVHFATLHLSINGPHFLETDALHCISDWQLATVPADYRGRVFLIPNSLVPEPRLDAARVAQLRAELGAQPGEFLVGGAGRIAASKGFDLLIRAFDKASLPDSQLVIVGEGRESARLRKLASGRVRFTGFRADVKQCFQAFDLFVSPSRREPFGRVIVEALDGGARVIATDTQGARDIARRYPIELVPIDDVDALAAALRRAHAAPRERVNVDLSEFYVERVVARMVDAYREVLAVHGGRSRSVS